MGHPDDYGDEMEKLTSQDADDLLSGGRPKAAPARAATAAVERLRRELLVTPGLEVSRLHLAAMRAAADSESLHAGGSAMRNRARKRVAALGLAATLVLGAGIAAALTLPDQAADQAKENIAGLEVPKGGPGNLGENGGIQSEHASEHGKAVSDLAHDESLEGCEKGREVSELASSKADNRKNESNGKDDPCTANADSNTGGLGTSNAGGQGKSNAGGQGKSNAGGQGKSNAGGQGKSNAGGQSSNARGQDSSTGGGPPEGKGAPIDLPTPGE
jgi:hypothetical protein